MKVNAAQLPNELKKRLAPLYLVSGDEPLLVQEACDAIRRGARDAGFEDRQVFHADAGFDWRQVQAETSALSLFATRRRLEIHLPKGRIGDGKEVVEQFLAQAPEDLLMLLIAPRLEASETRKAWFRSVQEHGVFVPVWPVDLDRFPDWLQQRAAGLGLTLTRPALEMLSERTEGNLLAAAQELERLSLLCPDGTVDETIINDAVLDSARFNAFEWVAEVLAGNQVHAQRMLTVLEQEGENPLGLLAILARDLRLALALNHHINRGLPVPQFLKQQNVRPPQRARTLEQCARRLNGRNLELALLECQAVDRAAKGLSSLSPWHHLGSVVHQLAGTHRA